MTILFRGFRCIDGLADTASDAVDILVDGATITHVDAHDPERRVPEEATVVDGAGRTILPGLIDAHAHYTFDPTEGSLQAIARRSDDEILAAAARHAGVALRAGVTMARGAGSIRNLEVRLRDTIFAGTVAGPRIIAAGTAVGAVDGHGAAFGLEASGRDAISAAVRTVRGMGADVIKVVASEAAMLTTTGHEPGRMVHGAPELTADEMRAIVETAKALGVRVMSHAQDTESVRRSVVAGVTSVEHAWLADASAIEAMSAAGTWLVPTLVVTDVNRTLPGLTPIQRERQDLIERRHRMSTEAAIRLGVPLATGTDTGEVGVTADMVWREIALLHDHGATPIQAIQAATSSGARLLGINDEVGTIEVGKRADLVVVEGDPLADLSWLASPSLVIQGGILVSA